MSACRLCARRADVFVFRDGKYRRCRPRLPRPTKAGLRSAGELQVQAGATILDRLPGSPREASGTRCTPHRTRHGSGPGDRICHLPAFWVWPHFMTTVRSTRRGTSSRAGRWTRAKPCAARCRASAEEHRYPAVARCRILQARSIDIRAQVLPPAHASTAPASTRAGYSLDTRRGGCDRQDQCRAPARPLQASIWGGDLESRLRRGKLLQAPDPRPAPAARATWAAWPMSCMLCDTRAISSPVSPPMIATGFEPGALCAGMARSCRKLLIGRWQVLHGIGSCRASTPRAADHDQPAESTRLCGVVRIRRRPGRSCRNRYRDPLSGSVVSSVYVLLQAAEIEAHSPTCSRVSSSCVVVRK